MLVHNFLLLLVGANCCKELASYPCQPTHVVSYAVVAVLGSRVRVEEYMQQHHEELAAITQAERNKQVTVWDAQSSLLRGKDFTYPVKEASLWGNRKTDKTNKERGKRQVHPRKSFVSVIVV